MAEPWQYNTFLPRFVAATSFGVVLGPVVAFFFSILTVLLLLFFYWILLRARSLCFMSRGRYN